MVAAHGSTLTLDFDGGGLIDYRYPTHGGRIDNETALGVALHYHMNTRALAPLYLRDGRVVQNSRGDHVYECQGHERWGRRRWALNQENIQRVLKFISNIERMSSVKGLDFVVGLDARRVAKMYNSLVLFDYLHG